jgi:hypothetical protein
MSWQRRDEMSEIGELCDFVNFNSLSQLERLPFLPADGPKSDCASIPGSPSWKILATTPVVATPNSARP